MPQKRSEPRPDERGLARTFSSFLESFSPAPDLETKEKTSKNCHTALGKKRRPALMISCILSERMSNHPSLSKSLSNISGMSSYFLLLGFFSMAHPNDLTFSIPDSSPKIGKQLLPSRNRSFTRRPSAPREVRIELSIPGLV